MIAELFGECLSTTTMECENIFADHREAYVKLVPASCLFKPKLRRLGWSGIILGKGIGLRGFVEKLVSSPAHYD